MTRSYFLDVSENRDFENCSFCKMVYGQFLVVSMYHLVRSYAEQRISHSAAQISHPCAKTGANLRTSNFDNVGRCIYTLYSNFTLSWFVE